MKHREEIMHILEAFDLPFLSTRRVPAGCSPNTVALSVTKRDPVS